jgi:hypothetical protein
VRLVGCLLFRSRQPDKPSPAEPEARVMYLHASA